MKKTILLMTTALGLCLLSLLYAFKPAPDLSKEIMGAWGFTDDAGNETVIIFSDNVISAAVFNKNKKQFRYSSGGTWRLDKDKLIVQCEWNSEDSTKVGKEETEVIAINNQQLHIIGANMICKRLDDGTPGALVGTWIISGNYVQDKVSKRANPFYPRRTMKVLSGKYFQWIAYNVVTKSFIATGGGTYTTANGIYTENIHYFTKTAESVGKSLQFEYAVVNDDWRHKGEKSTGGVLDECWTKRSQFEK
ncbi:MAG: hypothetical protein GXC72_02720 [Chitinophagaceae bacterium]|nr:hypothetical protein [Chitinophagaceae bacterium]